MQCKITGFHKDKEDDWAAELECHHGQHVRRNSPFINRPCVTTSSGRDAKTRKILNRMKYHRGEPIDIW